MGLDEPEFSETFPYSRQTAINADSRPKRWFTRPNFPPGSPADVENHCKNGDSWANKLSYTLSIEILDFSEKFRKGKKLVEEDNTGRLSDLQGFRQRGRDFSGAP